MSRGLGGIVETVMSLFVEAGGAGVRKGGGGLLMTAARSIGWANKSGGRGGRMAGHSLGGHRMGAGFGRGQDLSHYDPKTAHLQQQSAYYGSGAFSGSGLAPMKPRNTRPVALHGRSSFSGANTINGDPNNRWVRGGRGGNYGSYAPAPRSFIRFNK